jgi:hypothetical protein
MIPAWFWFRTSPEGRAAELEENFRTITPVARLTKTGRSRISRANCPR